MKETEEKLDVVPEMMKMTRTRTRTRTISKTIYTDREGNPVSDDVIQDIHQFQVNLQSRQQTYFTINMALITDPLPDDEEKRHHRRVVAVR